MTTAWRRAEAVAEVDLGDRIILCPLDARENACPVELSGSGSTVWALTDTTAAGEDVLVDRLLEEVEVDRETAAESVAALLTYLETLGLVARDAH